VASLVWGKLSRIPPCCQFACTCGGVRDWQLSLPDLPDLKLLPQQKHGNPLPDLWRLLEFTQRMFAGMTRVSSSSYNRTPCNPVGAVADS